MTLAPQDMMCFALYSAAHAMQQAYRPLLEPLGLTYPQYLVMSALWTAQTPPTVREISGQVQLESSTLTPLLKRLEAQGLLRRARDPRDERQVRIQLTEAGQALRAQAANIPARIATKTGLSTADLMELRDAVTLLRDRVRGDRVQGA